MKLQFIKINPIRDGLNQPFHRWNIAGYQRTEPQNSNRPALMVSQGILPNCQRPDNSNAA